MAENKPNPDFSNVQSGGSSTAPSPAPVKSAARTYTVVKGAKSAQNMYGNANKWRKIYEANTDLITNPDVIHPGQILKIPEA
jgi:nucleoid-associated protein YgaU